MLKDRRIEFRDTEIGRQRDDEFLSGAKKPFARTSILSSYISCSPVGHSE
jgi:hypothetical protein